MPVPQALVAHYVQLLVNRQFTESERELELLKQKMHKTEWNRGYFRALFGMYLARKANGDEYSFFSKLDFSDKTSLHAYKREFAEHINSKLHGDFDRGYFSAWVDCIRVLTRMNFSEVSASAQEAGKVKTLKSDKSQATMENFISEEEKA
jgi:hypothetical protein